MRQATILSGFWFRHSAQGGFLSFRPADQTKSSQIKPLFSHRTFKTILFRPRGQASRQLSKLRRILRNAVHLSAFSRPSFLRASGFWFRHSAVRRHLFGLLDSGFVIPPLRPDQIFISSLPASG
jgi:hypothetical protein